MTWQRSIQAAVRALKKEESALEKQLDGVRLKIEELDDMSRTRGAASSKAAASRRLSPAGRAAISKAAKRRWARYRADQRKRGARS
jgi:hypothetical protein